MTYHPIENADDNDHKRCQVAEPDVGAWAGVRVDKPLVDVVHEIWRRRIYRGSKVRHEGRQQAGDQEAEQADWHEMSERVWQHQLEVHVVPIAADVIAEEDKRRER